MAEHRTVEHQGVEISAHAIESGGGWRWWYTLGGAERHDCDGRALPDPDLALSEAIDDAKRRVKART